VLTATLSASPGTLVMTLPGDIKNHDASLFFDGPGSFTLVPHGILKRLVYKGLRCWQGFPHTPLTPTPSPETAPGGSTECSWQQVHVHNLGISNPDASQNLARARARSLSLFIHTHTHTHTQTHTHTHTHTCVCVCIHTHTHTHTHTTRI